MITVCRATKEGRARDRKSRRLILRIGPLQVHISRQEAVALHARLGKVLNMRRL